MHQSLPSWEAHSDNAFFPDILRSWGESITQNARPATHKPTAIIYAAMALPFVATSDANDSWDSTGEEIISRVRSVVLRLLISSAPSLSAECNSSEPAVSEDNPSPSCAEPPASCDAPFCIFSAHSESCAAPLFNFPLFSLSSAVPSESCAAP